MHLYLWQNTCSSMCRTPLLKSDISPLNRCNITLVRLSQTQFMVLQKKQRTVIQKKPWSHIRPTQNLHPQKLIRFPQDSNHSQTHYCTSLPPCVYYIFWLICICFQLPVWLVLSATFNTFSMSYAFWNISSQHWTSNWLKVLMLLTLPDFPEEVWL